MSGEQQPLLLDGDESERTMLLGNAAVPQYKGNDLKYAIFRLFPTRSASFSLYLSIYAFVRLVPRNAYMLCT